MTRPEPVVVSDFPSIKRDVTLKVSASDQAGKIIRYIHEGGLDSLQEVAVVDDFKRAEEEFRRVTYRVRFQRIDRTLQHEEVDVAMGGVLERLKEKYGVELAG
jgi:phenylalanyl-tRNA synthetase alpha chain